MAAVRRGNSARMSILGVVDVEVVGADLLQTDVADVVGSLAHEAGIFLVSAGGLGLADQQLIRSQLRVDPPFSCSASCSIWRASMDIRQRFENIEPHFHC